MQCADRHHCLRIHRPHSRTLSPISPSAASVRGSRLQPRSYTTSTTQSRKQDCMKLRSFRRLHDPPCTCSTQVECAGASEGSVLEAFYYGRAFAQLLGERLNSAVVELLSEAGKQDAERRQAFRCTLARTMSVRSRQSDIISFPRLH